MNKTFLIHAVIGASLAVVPAAAAFGQLIPTRVQYGGSASVQTCGGLNDGFEDDEEDASAALGYSVHYMSSVGLGQFADALNCDGDGSVSASGIVRSFIASDGLSGSADVTAHLGFSNVSGSGFATAYYFLDVISVTDAVFSGHRNGVFFTEAVHAGETDSIDLSADVSGESDVGDVENIDWTIVPDAVTPPVTATPEPATLALFVPGLFAVGAFARRRTQA